jgi:hypothetical protein
MQRREFVIATGSLLAAPGAVVPAAAATLPRPPLISVPAGLRILNGATFQGLLNQNFNVYESKRGVTMTLSAVRTPDKATPGSEQFSLVFSAPGVTLPSGTYEVEQDAIGMTAMYLQQGEPGQNLYLAHFNLLS